MLPIQSDEPFTEVSLEGKNLNKLKRQVYCKYCNYEIETNLPGAQCGKCSALLINVPKPPHVTNELA